MKDSLPNYIYTKYAMKNNGLQYKIIGAGAFKKNPMELVCGFPNADLMRKWLDAMGYALYSIEADYDVWFRSLPFQCNGCNKRFAQNKIFECYHRNKEVLLCDNCVTKHWDEIE